MPLLRPFQNRRVSKWRVERCSEVVEEFREAGTIDQGDPLTVSMHDVGIANLVAVSLFAAGLVLYDKHAAEQNGNDVKEVS